MYVSVCVCVCRICLVTNVHNEGVCVTVHVFLCVYLCACVWCVCVICRYVCRLVVKKLCLWPAPVMP